MVENEINEELHLREIETNLINNVVPKPQEFGEPSRTKSHFMRPRYVPAGHITNFSFGFISRKTATFEEIGLTPISQIGYILNIAGARNRKEIFEHLKRGMNSVLNLNTMWIETNFVNYIKHSFSDTIAN